MASEVVDHRLPSVWAPWVNGVRQGYVKSLPEPAAFAQEINDLGDLPSEESCSKRPDLSPFAQLPPESFANNVLRMRIKRRNSGQERVRENDSKNH